MSHQRRRPVPAPRVGSWQWCRTASKRPVHVRWLSRRPSVSHVVIDAGSHSRGVQQIRLPNRRFTRNRLHSTIEVLGIPAGSEGDGSGVHRIPEFLSSRLRRDPAPKRIEKVYVGRPGGKLRLAFVNQVSTKKATRLIAAISRTPRVSTFSRGLIGFHRIDATCSKRSDAQKPSRFAAQEATKVVISGNNADCHRFFRQNANLTT